MNALERGEIGELKLLLFGEDGQGGSLGRIERKLDQQDGRIATLERDRIAREAVAAAGSRLDDARSALRRWQVTAAVAIIGTAASLLFGFVNVVLPRIPT